MTHVLEQHGRYLSYELQALSEVEGKNILEAGIDEDTLDDFAFLDGGETGFTTGQLSLNGKVLADFSIEKMSPDDLNEVEVGWYLIRIETGSINYRPMSLSSPFDKNLFEVHPYFDSVNGYILSYALFTYNENDFEIDSQNAETVEILLVDPEGNAFVIGGG